MLALRELTPQPCVTSGSIDIQREEGGCPRPCSKWEVQNMNPDLSVLVTFIFCKLGLQRNLLKSQPNRVSWTEGQEWAQEGHGNNNPNEGHLLSQHCIVEGTLHTHFITDPHASSVRCDGPHFTDEETEPLK